MENKRPRVCVIINAHNEGPDLERTVRSFREHAGECALNFVIVADGTTDGSTDVFHGESVSDVLVVAKPDERLGCGKAKDLGVREALRVFAPDVIFHNDAHNRMIRGTVADVARECLERSPCIITPALGPLRCPAPDCVDRCGPTCTVECPRIDENIQPPDNCYQGGTICAKENGHGQEGLSVRNHLTRGKERVTLTEGVNPSCFAYSVETLSRLGGWNLYPGIWGSQELGISLRAWFTATPIFVLRDDYVCCLHRYRSWNHPEGRALAPYAIPTAHDSANQRYAYAVVFADDTYRRVWKPWFDRFHQNADADALVEKSECVRQHAEFQELKKRSDEEFFQHVFGRSNPKNWSLYAGASRALYCISAGIGNAMMCVPAMKALAELSGRRIDVLDVGLHQRERARDVFAQQPFVDQVLTETPDLASYKYIIGSYWGKTPYFTPYDAVVENVRQEWRTRHEVECNFDAVRRAGYACSTIPTARIRTIPTTIDGHTNEYIVIGTGCAGIEAKKYPHWQKVCEQLSTETRLIFLGGKVGAEEPDRDEEVWMSEYGDNMYRRTDIARTASIIAGARLYVGIDNGLSHIAASTRTPMILLYGPSSERKNLPWSSDVRVLRSGCYDCEPCWDHPRAKRCPNPVDGCRPCMTAIHPDRVVSAVHERLQEEGWARCPDLPWYLSRRQRIVNSESEVRGDAAMQARTLAALRASQIERILVTPKAAAELDYRWLHVLRGITIDTVADPRVVYDAVVCTTEQAGDFGGARILVIDGEIHYH